MGEACVKHLRNAMSLANHVWDLKSIVDNIFVFRCKEITELLSCVSVLNEFLQHHPKVFHNLRKKTITAINYLFIYLHLGKIDSDRQFGFSLSSRCGKRCAKKPRSA